MYIKMLPEIEKFKEAKEAFASSNIQFNIGDVHIIHKHALRGCMNQRGFKYLIKDWAQTKAMHQYFSIKDKKLLEHLPNFSEANVYKDASGNRKVQRG